MSLFGAIFGNFLESAVAREFAAYKNSIREMIRQEDRVLRSLNLPVPTLVSELDYQHKTGDEGQLFIYLVPPKFDLPPHRVLAIKEDDEFFQHEDRLVATLFENLNHVDYVCWWWGLADLITDNYGCVWTNRDPYAFYRELQKKPESGFTCKKAGDFTSVMDGKVYSGSERILHAQAKKLPALERVEGLSRIAAARLHLRIRLYNFVTDGYYPSLHDARNYYEPGYEAATEISSDILFKLPVPRGFGIRDYSSLKIICSGEIKPARMIEFLASLRGAVKSFISFELISKGATVYFRLRFVTKVKERLIRVLNLYFPDFELIDEEPKDPLPENIINWLEKKSYNEPLRHLGDFQLDPYAHFASFFDGRAAAANEPLCYQVMFAPFSDEAAAILGRHLQEEFSHRPEYYKKFVKKLPLWFFSLSVNSPNERTSDSFALTVSKTFDTPAQQFSATHKFTMPDRDFPMMLPSFVGLCGADELAAMVHFPTTVLPIERLEKTSMKNVQPPQLYTSGDVRVGVGKARGQNFAVTIPEEVRDRHLYIVGKSGTGKSTLMATLARRDIEAGRGVAVIDPHGDLIHYLLQAVPDYRASDCIVFSPKLFPLSLEILSAKSEQEIDLLSDDLITMFRRTSESWGDKMQAILQMAFQTLLRIPGSSFTDITPLLTDESYRSRILSRINHPQLASFWQHRYEMRQAEPILIRMDRLTTSGTLRAVLTQNKNSLNFYDVITKSKIFLADLSKGFLGESTSHLLGSIIVSQIQLAAMRQAHLPQEQRIPFSLFVDEVQNFTTSAFTTILSEARKQKLRLTIAHQFVSQLPSDIQKAVFGNVGTMMFFALSPDDLGAARHELGTFEPQDVANLPKYHALCRPATAARDTFSFVTDAPHPTPLKNNSQWIIEQTRSRYGSATDSVNNAEVNRSSEDFQGETQPDVIVETPLSEPIQNASRSFSPPLSGTMMPIIDRRRPAPAQPLVFQTNTEKILHFLRQAEYLSQPQIIALTDLQASNASTALKKLVESGQIKSLDERRPKIYFLGRTANPTPHNLLVRDLFVKISQSKFAARAIKFNENLPDINPDLSVEFIVREGSSLSILPAYFELDRGTEGVGELVRKADRYARLEDNPRVCFVFERESDLVLARKTIHYPFVSYAVLDQFSTLNDEAFYAAGDHNSSAAPTDVKLPFFR